MTAEIYKE